MHRPLSATACAAALAALALAAGCAPDQPAPAPSTATTASGAASSEAGTPGADTTSSGSASAQAYPVSSLSPSPVKAVASLTYTSDVTRSTPWHVTMNIVAVRASATGTTLTFWANAPESTGAGDTPLNPGDPSAWPVLVDPSSRTRYGVDTYRGNDDLLHCVVSLPGSMSPTTVRPLDAEYPPLPSGVTSVQVTIAGASKPVTVPVTR